MEVNPKLLADDGKYYPNEGIFAHFAPSYWAAGLPVFPLQARDKKANVIKQWCNWTELAKRMPTEEEKQAWLKQLPDCNIGLPLGPQSRCVAIDIDTDDKLLINIIQSVCGFSPWERVGSKGKVLLYRYSGELPFKILTADKKTICECLSTGNQVVLPPSIHPVTQKPYKANTSLPDVVNMLKPLPANFEETLRNALKDAGIELSHSGWTRVTDYVSHGSRDVKMTAMAGLFAAGVTRGERSLLESIDMLRAWKAACVENVAGDDIDIEKGVQNLIKFLISDVLGPKHKVLPQGWDDGMTPEMKKDWGLEFSDDMIEWGIDQILNYLEISIDKMDDIVKRNGVFEYIIQKMSRSPHLTSTEKDLALGKMAELSDKTLTKASLKNRLKELETEDLEGKNQTEIAEAVLSEMKKVGDVKFCWDNFWQWQGSNWEMLEKTEILCTIAKEYGHYPAAKKASDHKGVMDIMKSLSFVEDLATVPEKGINFANGFLDQDGVLREHNAAFGCTYTLPYRYLPELVDNHPKFDHFLESIWGEEPDFEERKKALQEAMCATYFGIGHTFARAILLYGTAGSGKSQLLDIVRYMLPKKMVTYIAPYGFEKDFLATELSKSLLNVCGELAAGKNIPDDIFKSVVDGSSMQGAYKYGQYFSFAPKCTHWFASNNLPKSKDTSNGFFRRWLIFTFKKPVKEEERVRGLGEIIAAEERESIMAWVVSCVKELVKKGDYTLPESHKKMMDTMIGENDSVFFYLKSEEGPKRKEGGKLQLNQLYERYSTYCYSVSKNKPVGLRVFLNRLMELSVFLNFEVNGLEVRGLSLD